MVMRNRQTLKIHHQMMKIYPEWALLDAMNEMTVGREGVYTAPETVQHTVAGCEMQDQAVYTERHKQAGKVLSNICTCLYLKFPESQWEKRPEYG